MTCDDVLGLAVDPGCGISVDALGVSFNANYVAGTGLSPEGDCKLSVDPMTITGGCGITVTGGATLTPTIVFDATDVASYHFSIIPAGSCGLAVNYSCGLKEGDDNKLQVDATDLVAGVAPGLEIDATTCGIKAKVGCGLDINATDGIIVKTSDLTGAHLTPAALGCALDVEDSGTITVISSIDSIELELIGTTLKVTLNYKTMEMVALSSETPVTATPLVATVDTTVCP